MSDSSISSFLFRIPSLRRFSCSQSRRTPSPVWAICSWALEILPCNAFRRSNCCSLTEATLPSRDSRIPLNIRAGIRYRRRYSCFKETADRPAATSAKSLR